MRSFHYEYLARVLPSLTKLVQFKNSGISSSKCSRPECQLSDLTADSQHISYECVYVSSILYFINHAYIKDEIPHKLDDLFYLFPFVQAKQYYLSLEFFVLSTQIKMSAFQVCLEDRFSTWNHNHFYVQLLKILKNSIEICELYSIPISTLHLLLDYAELAALGLLWEYITDYALINGINID